jgi:DNA-binding CsgD family transcriptional regulator
MSRSSVSDLNSEPAPLQERALELAALQGVVDSVRTGRGRLVLIEGDAGMGKSRLLSAALEMGRDAALFVVSARGLELERDFAFGLVLRLFQPALTSLDRPARARLFAGAARPAANLLDGSRSIDLVDGLDHGAALILALRQLTLRFPAVVGDPPRRGVLVCVDDAHWADLASLRFLLNLVADVEALPIAVLVTIRPGAARAPIEMLARLRGQPGGMVLRPAVLSYEALEQVVRIRYPQASAEFVSACAATTAGNPFYLTELLEAANDHGLIGDSKAAVAVSRLVPEGVLRSVILRLAGLSPAARAVADAVAILGGPSSLRLVAALAQIDQATADDAAHALAAERILQPGDQLGFTHALLGAAIRADLSSHARSRAHRRAADLLAADGASPEEVATHLLACRPVGDAEVVRMLEHGARYAAGQGEYPTAIRFLERCLLEPPAPEDRPDLLVALGLATAAVGSPDAVTRLADALRVAPGPRQRVELRQATARLQFVRSDFAGAASTIEQCLAELPDEDPLARQLVRDRLALAAVGPAAPASLIKRPPKDPQAARRLAAESGLLGQLAHQLVASCAPAKQAREVAREALASDDAGFYGMATGFAVMALLYIDELDLAATPIEAALDRARDTGSLIALGFASHWRSTLRWYRGDLAGAIADAEQTLEICRAGWDVCRGWVAPVLAHAHLDRGDVTSAAKALERCSDINQGMEIAFGYEARGRLALVNGNPSVALSELKAAGSLLENDFGITAPTVLPWRSRAALAALQLGDRDQAVELSQVELKAARAIGAPRALGVSLRAAGRSTGGDAGLELLAEAIVVLEKSPTVLEQARAFLDLGRASRQAGDVKASREPLRSALDIAERLGAVPLAAEALRELRAAGGRLRQGRPPKGAAALTPTERTVAQLAAESLRTPEIANRLYLSPKTVEWHLTNVYRKLGIRARAQLAGALLDKSI